MMNPELLSQASKYAGPKADKFLLDTQGDHDSEHKPSAKRNIPGIEMGSLSDPVLLEVMVMAKREAFRRGIAPGKSLSLLQMLGYLTNEGEGIGLARVLMMAILLPTVRKRLEQVFFQAVREGVELADNAGSIFKKTRRSIETIVKEDILRN